MTYDEESMMPDSEPRESSSDSASEAAPTDGTPPSEDVAAPEVSPTGDDLSVAGAVPAAQQPPSRVESTNVASAENVTEAHESAAESAEANQQPVAEVPVSDPDSPEQPAATTPPDEPPPAVRSRPAIKIGSQRETDSAEKIKAKPQDIQVPTADQPGSEAATPAAPKQFPPPRLSDSLTADLEHELEAAMAGVAMDELLTGNKTDTATELEEGARLKGRVLSIRNENVFVDLGGRNQGVVSVKQFAEPTKQGAILDVIVTQFDSEEGLYELVVPGAAVDVGDWSELAEGMVVDAVVTGHNKGGLECEVNKLRGFIPASQVGLYRVDNLEEFVGQRFACIVTEVKPERRNLVLSRRAVLEREKAEAKETLLKSLEVGQIYDGIVRRLQPFGAFVDLGGVDGLLHISQLSWDRIKHPSEVLEEGQSIRVQVAKIDPETGKIGLAYRDTWDNPWDAAADKYKPKSTIQGTVSRLTDFGAFVRLEPGIEGLVHVSELAHQRVWRPSDVLSEGQEVDVMILSVDAGAQRISLSLKALQARPERETKKEATDEDVAVPSPPLPKAAGKPRQELRGGTNKPTGGEEFGLKW